MGNAGRAMEVRSLSHLPVGRGTVTPGKHKSETLRVSWVHRYIIYMPKDGAVGGRGDACIEGGGLSIRGVWEC